MRRVLQTLAVAISGCILLAGTSSGAATLHATNSGRCQSVPQATISNIELGVRTSYQRTVHFSSFQAVRSQDREMIYYVAAKVGPRPGSDDWGIAIWALNRLDHSTGQTGVIYAMPDIATTYTDWGNGATTRARLSAWDDGYTEARQCARS
jgi:hypothetical protein